MFYALYNLLDRCGYFLAEITKLTVLVIPFFFFFYFAFISTTSSSSPFNSARQFSYRLVQPTHREPFLHEYLARVLWASPFSGFYSGRGAVSKAPTVRTGSARKAPFTRGIRIRLWTRQVCQVGWAAHTRYSYYTLLPPEILFPVSSGAFL